MAESDNRALQAARLFDAGDYEGAHHAAQAILRENPDDADALFVVATCATKADEFGSAIPLFKRASEIKPSRAEIWNNLGMCYTSINRPEAALAAFQRAQKLRPENPNFMANIGQAYLTMGKCDTAIEWCDRAIKADPLHTGGTVTRGFSHLAKGEWAKGWTGYRAALGGKFRMQQDFGLPEWQGEPCANVVVYFEQGLGDEIMHASAVPDLLATGAKVALDCDPRIVKLFRRTFASAKCHGTRRDDKPWFKASEWTHQIAAGDLFGRFRPDWRECPGAPFLRVNDDLRTMYEALIDKYAQGKTRIGLAWAGGNYLTNAAGRRITLEALRPMIEAHPECAFFSLDYHDTADAEIKASGLPVHHFRYAVGQGADFDHTAAFVSCLDRVVGIHTTVHHAAGALGVPSMILVPHQPSWLYGAYQGDRWCLYPKTAGLFRQGPGERWAHVTERMIDTPAWRAFMPRALKVAHA